MRDISRTRNRERVRWSCLSMRDLFFKKKNERRYKKREMGKSIFSLQTHSGRKRRDAIRQGLKEFIERMLFAIVNIRFAILNYIYGFTIVNGFLSEQTHVNHFARDRP